MKTRRNERVVDMLTRWSHWRIGYRYGSSTTVLGRLLAGMPGTHCPTCYGRGWTMVYPTCPTCVGTGRIKARPMSEKVINATCKTCEVKDKHGNRRSTGEVNGATCLTCRGSGRHIRVTAKINPAFIPGRLATYHDADSVRIEQVMYELSKKPRTQSYFFVLLQEYTRTGTRRIKAERMNITDDYYRKLLQRAHERMAFELGLMRGTLLRFVKPCTTVTKQAING